MQIYMENSKREKPRIEEKKIHYIKNQYKMKELRVTTI